MQGVTRGYWSLQKGSRKLEEARRGERKLEEVTRDYKAYRGLLNVTGD